MCVHWTFRVYENFMHRSLYCFDIFNRFINEFFTFDPRNMLFSIIRLNSVNRIAAYKNWHIYLKFVSFSFFFRRVFIVLIFSLLKKNNEKKYKYKNLYRLNIAIYCTWWSLYIFLNKILFASENPKEVEKHFKKGILSKILRKLITMH